MISFDAPLQGIQAAATRVNAVANRVANLSSSTGGGDLVDLSAEMVALLEAKFATGANVNVAHAMDEMSQSLLNIVG